MQLAKNRTNMIITLIFLLLINVTWAKSKAYLGVNLKNLSLNDYQDMGIVDNVGILITGIVDDSPAQKAGLEQNDVIMKLDGEKIYTYDQFTKMLQLFKPEQVVKLTVWRGNDTKKINLTLGEKKIYEKKKRAYLGVYLNNLSEKDYDDQGISGKYGIIIKNVVEKSPAEKAGMKQGDIILSLNKDRIYTVDQFTKMLKNQEPGDEVKLTLQRDKKEQELTVTLGEKELGTFSIFDNNFSFDFLGDPDNMIVYQLSDSKGKWIGVMTMNLNDQLKKNYGVDDGVMITQVLEDTPAEKAGLLAGDIILQVADRKIVKQNDITKAIQDIETGKEVEVKILRDKKPLTIKVKVGERQKQIEADKMELSIDDDEIRIWIDGEHGLIYDLEESIEGLQKLYQLKSIDVDDLEGKITDKNKELEIEIKKERNLKQEI